MALLLLFKNGIIKLDNCLDYAAGYGRLAKILDHYFDHSIKTYDPYIKDNNNDHVIDSIANKKFDLVLNSAMFEHVLERDALDKIHHLVSPHGTMMVHTVVCENIPADPNWFYLRPIVHTAFHTNKSMSLLMAQWGYLSSLYAPKAKSWFLLRQKPEAISSVIHRINNEIKQEFFLLKEGFLDFWKGF